jgi:hypothetical protein
MSDSEALPLLNVFEVTDDKGVLRHLLAFIEPVLAGSNGIDPRSIVGEITPTETGYDPSSLKLNPEFIEAFTAYMNEVQAGSPEITNQARTLPSGWVYIIDPRNTDDDEEIDPPSTDLVGAFAVDDIGQVVPQSFQYNANHALIDQERGVTGLFSDRHFYDWLHPQK